MRAHHGLARLASPMALASLLVLQAAAALAQPAPDKASPFTAVRWEGEEPRVQFQGNWYRLEKLNDLNTDEILAFARKTYGKRWQKRFSEDLVELLTRMGHAPGVDARLVLLPESGEPLSTVAQMTKDNRRSVLEYNRGEREPPPTRGATPGPAATAGKPTAGGDHLARQFAEYIDQIWDKPPEAGSSNLRFLLRKDGKAMAGKLTASTEFSFQAAGPRGQQVTQGFNPNANGRWVYEELSPGTWSVEIRGAGDHAGFHWRKDGISVGPGDTPLFQVDVDK